MPSPNQPTTQRQASQLAQVSRRFRLTPIALAFHVAVIGTVIGASGLPEAHAQVAAAQETARQYDIPAGSLDQVLGRFGQAARVMVAIDPELTAGLQSPGLRGSYAVPQALTSLLGSHELEAVPGTNGGYRLRRKLAATPLERTPASGTTLPAVTVTAANSELPPVYAGGQVARGGRLGMLGNRDVLDTPFNITSYTAQVIEDQQARTLADVLANDASVRATTSAGHGMETFRVRGFDLWMGDLSFNGLYGIAPDGHTPTELFERVEILRGPSALLSGMAPGGSVGGAVNLVPKRAGNVPLTRLTANYAGEANVGAHIDVARRYGENQEVGVRFNGLLSDGRTGVDGQAKSRELGALALDYRGRRVRASLDAYASSGEQKGGSVFMASFVSSIPKAPDGETNVFPGAYSNIENEAVLGRVEYDIADDWTAYATAGRRLHRYDGFLRGTYLTVQPNGNATGVHRNYRGYSDTNSGEIGVRGKFQTGPVGHEVVVTASGLSAEGGLSFSGGANLTTNIYNPVSFALADAAGPVSKGTETVLTSYAVADTLSFLDDRLLLTLGLRDQRVRNRSLNAAGVRTADYDQSAVTPAVGVVVKPWQAPVSIYANYIEGLSQGATVTDVAAPNYLQVFAPYKTQQAEVGVKWDAGRFLNTVSVFQITKPSLIRNATTLVYSDDGEQRNRGVEWTTAGEVARGTRLLGGVSYTRAVMTRTVNGTLNGNRAFGVPVWTGNLGAEWDASWFPGLTLTGRVTYTGKQYLNSTNTQQVPGFTVADIGARYATKVSGRDVVLRAAINNAFNQRYWLGGFGEGYAQVGAGRLFLMSASVDF